MKIFFEIPDDAIEILKRIDAEGGAEFKDSEYQNVQEFKNTFLEEIFVIKRI